MNKFFSFAAGALCGALVGSATALLLAPAPGDEVLNQARQRLGAIATEMRQAKEETEKEVITQFEQMKQL